MRAFWAKVAAACGMMVAWIGAASAQNATAENADPTVAAYYYMSTVDADEALIGLLLNEKLEFGPRYATDPIGLSARLTERRLGDLAARGVEIGGLPQALQRCMGSIDFEALSPQRLYAPLDEGASPSLWRARIIARAASDLAESVARRDPDRPLRDVVLDRIVAYCVADR